ARDHGRHVGDRLACLHHARRARAAALRRRASGASTLPPVGGEGRPRERNEPGPSGGATLGPSPPTLNRRALLASCAAPPRPRPLPPPLGWVAGGGGRGRRCSPCGQAARLRGLAVNRNSSWPISLFRSRSATTTAIVR